MGDYGEFLGEGDDEPDQFQADNDAAFESKHKRDNDGKFAKLGETSVEKIEIQGNELGSKSMSSEELRQRAISYYKNHLAGTSVEHPKLGKILFSNSGFKKPISFSADTRKLKLFPFLPEIIKNGEIIEEENDRRGRSNIDYFYTLKSKVILDGKEEFVRISVRKDNSGKLYYDHVIEKALKSTPTGNKSGGLKSFNSIVSNSEYIVNIFFEENDAERGKACRRAA